jgi:hypothetical protein
MFSARLIIYIEKKTEMYVQLYCISQNSQLHKKSLLLIEESMGFFFDLKQRIKKCIYMFITIRTIEGKKIQRSQ